MLEACFNSLMTAWVLQEPASRPAGPKLENTKLVLSEIHRVWIRTGLAEVAFFSSELTELENENL
jgi:hypothetical protein